jgi:hypothetical protein
MRPEDPDSGDGVERPASTGQAAEDEAAPYCSACGYRLTGLTESSRCPECGRPLVEVLTRPQWFTPRGRHYRSQLHVFGLPLVHIAMGPEKPGQFRGRAKGVIAIGDIATGFVAFGGLSAGLVAIGGMAIGLISFGGMAVGLLVAWGGLAIGGMAAGGGAAGFVAMGGGAVGFIADGGGAAGYIARGGGVRGRYTLTFRGYSPGAAEQFERWAWLIGRGMPRPGQNAFLASRLILWMVLLTFIVLLLLALVVLAGLALQREKAR